MRWKGITHVKIMGPKMLFNFIIITQQWTQFRIACFFLSSMTKSLKTYALHQKKNTHIRVKNFSISHSLTELC